VVLEDERFELAGEAVLAQQLEPVADVAGDDQVREVGGDAVVGVVAA
jgi:hypothetical protein